MASRTAERINLPGKERRSVPVTDIPQVQVPLLNGGAQRLLAMGAITSDMADTVSKIDQKNQETAAEKEFTSIFLEAQKEINDFHASATGDEDISGQTLAIYDKFMNGLESRGLPSAQVEIVRGKLAARQAAVGQMGLDYEMKLKSAKYDADLDSALENSANIVAGDPRLFNDQLKNMEGLIAGARLNGAQKAEKLNSAKQMMGRVYLTRLSELNPGKARAEANSEAMNAIIDPQFKASLLSKLDAEVKAKASLELQDDVKSIEQARKLGVTVPAEFITTTAKRARAAGNERQARALEKYAGVQDYAVALSQKPLAEQQLEMRELRMKAKLGDLSDLDRLEAADEIYREKITALAADPWSYYASKGVIDAQEDSLVGLAPEQAAPVLQRRRAEQEKISQLEGGAVRLPLITPREVAQLSEMKDTTEPKQLAATLTSLGQNLSGQERREVVRLVAAKEPLLAVAMSQDYDKATRTLAGRAAKGEVTEAQVREKATAKLAGVTVDGAVNDTLHAAIYATYKQLALEKGDTGKVAQSTLLDQAVRDVVGEVVDVNTGKPSRVIAPAGMTAWQVEDRLGAINDELLAEQQGQLPMTSDGFRATAADILRFGRFVSAGDGVVAVQFPTGALYRDDGKIYTIDINRIDDTSTSRAKTRRALETSRTGAR